MSYRVREATLDDADVLVRHRVAMFTDMGLTLDAPALRRRVSRVAGGADVGGRLSRMASRRKTAPSPARRRMSWCLGPHPGPSYMGDKIAIVYNVYTEPGHPAARLARLIRRHPHMGGRPRSFIGRANAKPRRTPALRVNGISGHPSPR